LIRQVVDLQETKCGVCHKIGNFERHAHVCVKCRYAVHHECHCNHDTSRWFNNSDIDVVILESFDTDLEEQMTYRKKDG